MLLRFWPLAFLIACSNDMMPPPLDAGRSDTGLVGDGAPIGNDGSVDAGPPPPICDPGWTYGAGAAVAGVPAGDKMFAAVSADELTVAWVSPQGTISFADRSDASQPFGAPQSVPGTFAHERVALAGDGLVMVVVLANARAFAQLTRMGRGQAFGNPDPSPFKDLTKFGGEADAAPPGDSGAPIGTVGDPVLSADGRTFFFSVYNVNSPDTVCVTTKPNDVWIKLSVLVQPELVAMGASRRRPTGLSSDARTLFWWDEVDKKEHAGWRATSSPGDYSFKSIVSLGDKKDAQPTKDCKKLYFSAPPAPPQDVESANKN